ncbi:MAG: hypothetical protein SH847_07065 [Roseiflexaceae bacterium]|nr:hypothetical protein [Roseiflexaceae bacterium]
MRFAAWLLPRLARRVAARLLRRRDFYYLGLPLPSGSSLDHFPVVGYKLPQAVASGQVQVYPAVECLTTDVAHFSNDRSAPFDTLIMATGYRPALDSVAHMLTFNSEGQPILDRYGRAHSNPRLVCVGYNYPTTEGWLQAIGRTARTAVNGIVALRLADLATTHTRNKPHKRMGT